jgi:hypothetical protein
MRHARRHDHSAANDDVLDLQDINCVVQHGQATRVAMRPVELVRGPQTWFGVRVSEIVGAPSSSNDGQEETDLRGSAATNLTDANCFSVCDLGRDCDFWRIEVTTALLR